MLLFQLVHIRLHGTRIFFKVFVRAELQTIDKNTRNHGIAMYRRQAHQAQMSFVQITHRRHESHTVLPVHL